MVRLAGDRVALRSLVFEDAPALTAIVETPEVAEFWGEADEGFPFNDKPDAARLTITLGARVIGLIEYGQKSDPGYRGAWIDIFLDPELHDQGLGTDAVSTLVRHLTHELGHHRVTIDPAVDNAAAIRLAEKVGFKRVGTLRAAGQLPDGSRSDLLLLDLLASEVDPPES
jgi:RimJ/RimL family protein N-acetyltransferase